LLNDCDEEVQGGIPNIIILDCGHQLTDEDISNGTAVNDEITAGRAWLLKNVKVGAAAPSATTVDSNIALKTPKVTKYTTEFTLVDGNVNNTNSEFYNQFGNGQPFGGLILHQPDEGIVLFYNNDFRGMGGLVVPDNDGEFMRFEYSMSMDSKPSNVNPVYAPEPTGVFS
jgi:hypothetical protein